MAPASFFVRASWDAVTLLSCGVFVAVSFARARPAHAQDASGMPTSSIAAPPSSASGASPEPPASGAEPTAPPPESASPSALEPDSVEAPAPASASAAGRAELERRLHGLEEERAHWTNFWPWLTVGTGVGVTALGTVVGVGAAFDCKENTKCSAPPWATLFVVVGVAIGAAGAIWLVRTDHDIRELELETQRVRSDLEQLEHSRVVRDRDFARTGTPLNLQLSF